MAPHATQPNADRKDSALFLNDLVSLPIIITDFDVETGNNSKNKKSDGDKTPPSSGSPSSAGSPSMQKWATGFNDFADEMWKSMSDAMKAKLREAAVEVLKRTDDTRSGAGATGNGEEGLWGTWDEDAMFLD